MKALLPGLLLAGQDADPQELRAAWSPVADWESLQILVVKYIVFSDSTGGWRLRVRERLI